MPRLKRPSEMPAEVQQLQKLVQQLSAERRQLINRLSELLQERESILANIRSIYEGARMRELRGPNHGGGDASDHGSDTGDASDAGHNGLARDGGVLGD